jgi:hypothetical protein
MPVIEHSVAGFEDLRCDDGRRKKLRGWLLELLRFAITHDAEDQTAALASAGELDDQKPQGQSGFHFFVRTTNDVCRAIVSVDDPTRVMTLRGLVARINDQRLRRAFVTAAEIEAKRDMPCHRANQRKPPAVDLWKGLRAR